ncbi:hypothetical protein BHE74_00025160 [Ensete ventricosum]|uniref:Uncharacterized protein n=1 Tax=Ensete ventricosum TaxID=4639 RepID=A0A426ZME3_ENSVE|nr:hypothetical protein B296_00038790 [Ensete ventricosum]RWV82293.1 hypothetical protein GW17_00056217 [Ensete ventricosum]RWW67394.1 hypothetical protein BHE74_00025160 [Ensete ventricosum]
MFPEVLLEVTRQSKLFKRGEFMVSAVEAAAVDPSFGARGRSRLDLSVVKEEREEEEEDEDDEEGSCSQKPDISC